jgi:prolipoprotein diacylglyceryltransferase
MMRMMHLWMHLDFRLLHCILRHFGFLFDNLLHLLNFWILLLCYPCPSETFRGSNFCVFDSYYSPLSLYDKKGEYFYFGPELYF